jgi:ribosome-associated toxin RatA of RatAB toxin-antitoxin module
MNPAVWNVILVLATAEPSAWTEIHHTDTLTVSTRARPGIEVEEMRAVAIVDAAADAVWAVVSDIEGHTRLIPNTTMSKVIAADGDSFIVFERFEPPVLDARESVIAAHARHETLVDGRVRNTLSWRAAPGYAQLTHDDAVRVEVNQGFWCIEELVDGRTRITFQLLFDPAGHMPALLVNLSHKTGAEQVLAILTRAARHAGS